MIEYLRDKFDQTTVRAAKMRKKLQIKLAVFTSHSILTSGGPVPTQTLYPEVPDRVATGVPMFESLVLIDVGKDPRRKRESNHGLRLSRQVVMGYVSQ